MDCHPQRELSGPQLPLQGTRTAISTENWALIQPSIRGVSQTYATPSRVADWGTMKSLIGPIVADSDIPASLGGLPELLVGRNMFAAGPISPIVDQLDAENRQIGRTIPDPHNYLAPAREAVTLIQQALSRCRQNPTMVDSSPAPMSGLRRFPFLVEESPALEAYPDPPNGCGLKAALIVEALAQLEEHECDRWSLPSLDQGRNDEREEMGVLERRKLRHSPMSVASSPAPPEPMSGKRDRATLVDESPASHYIVGQDPTCCGGGVPSARERRGNHGPCLDMESPPGPMWGHTKNLSQVPMNGTKDQPSLVDDSPTFPKVDNLCLGGENPLEGGSATLLINLVSPPSTRFPVEEAEPRAIPNSGGAEGGITGAELVSAPAPQMQPPTVVHETPHYIVVEESPPPAPRRNPIGSVSHPPSPRGVTYIQHVDGISYLIRPSMVGSSGGDILPVGGHLTPAPDTLVSPCGEGLWSFRGEGTCLRGGWWVISPPAGVEAPHLNIPRAPLARRGGLT